MTLIAILVAISVPMFATISAGSRASTCAANMKAIAQALRLYWQDFGAYPATPNEATAEHAAAAATDRAAGRFAQGERPRGFGGLADLYPQYLQNLSHLRCPANRVRAPEDRPAGKKGWNQYFRDTQTGWQAADIRNFDPSMWGYHNYGAYYHREGPPDQWRAFYHRHRPSIADADLAFRRQLRGSVTGGLVFVPASTVITWCVLNRRSGTGAALGLTSHPSDIDLVLFVDGTVERLRGRNDQQLPDGDWTGQWDAVVR